MNDKSVVTRGTWAAGFTVASVWFGTHVGGGFATGKQIIQYFVQYGWTAAVYPLLAMGMLAYIMFVMMRFARLRGIDNYKDAFCELWQPYPKMELTFELFYIIIILAAMASAVAGAASLVESLLGLPYGLSVVIIAAVLVVLSIFGVKLIITASTILSTGILIVTGIMVVSGISTHTAQIGTALSAGISSPLTAFWRGVLVYCAFQCVSIPAMIAAATTLNQGGVKKAAILGGLMNGIALALSGLMLLGWYDEIVAAGKLTLPNLFVAQSIGWNWLIGVYSILLFCAFISTCITLVYTMINRFEGKMFPKQITNVIVRRTLVGAIVIGICMSISFLGLSSIVKYGYGYCGYLSLVVVVLPVLFIGTRKNKKFLAEHPNALADDAVKN
jgi:uncharacterized membrane protein YkvI